MHIDEKLQMAARIVVLREELARLEAAFQDGTPIKPRPPAQPSGKGRAPERTPSVSERVMHMIRQAGPEGITRRDILAVLPQHDAVASALKVHARAGRIYSDNGYWKLDEVLPKDRPTRELQAVQPQ